MSLPIVIALLLLAALVVIVISAPIRAASRPQQPGADAGAEDAPTRQDLAGLERDELQAAREAKYREIRDAELDFRTGKLSDEDYQAIDADLRAEALEILDRLERYGDGEQL